VTLITAVSAHRFSEYDALKFVLGKGRLNTHVSEASEHVTEWEPTDGPETLYIACTGYSTSIPTRKVITAMIGETNIHTAFADKVENAVCFAIYASSEEAHKIKKLPTVSACTRIPNSLKIHESVMYILGLTKHDTEVHSALAAAYERPLRSHKSNLQIVVSSGVGVKHKSAGRSLQDASAVKHLLVNSHPAHYVDMLTRDHANAASSAWEQASVTLHAAHNDAFSHETCAFHKLSIEHTGHSLVISNIHEIDTTSFPHACYASLLALLASQPETADIRFRFPKRAFNNYNKGIVQTDVRQQSYPYQDAGIDGSGQVVGVGDTGLDELSCFFRNEDGSKVDRSDFDNPTYNMSKRKVIQYIDYCDDTDTEGGHGTHVSGTVAGELIGSDITYENYGGHGMGAKIAFFDMEFSSNPERGIRYPSPIGENVFLPAYEAGARIHSNSWGTSYNLYDDDTADTDDFLVNYVDFLVLFAAGNDGSEGYYSLGNPAVSKNAVSVGATMSSDAADIEKMAFFSSLGPTFDNRIKPDISAPGYFTYSSKASGTSDTETCEIVSMAGTSMATPAVAGMAAQIRQYFTDYNNTALLDSCLYFNGTDDLKMNTCDAQPNPRGATIKAMLVHSGGPMDSYESNGYDTKEPTANLGMPPDMYQGFGRVSLQNVLPYPGVEDVMEIYVVEACLSAEQSYTHTLQIGGSTRPFKATLVYMDPANTIISTKMLLHNLDLTVEDADGNVYYGNGIAGDDVNNVEQVYLQTPTITNADWTVTVSGDVFPESGDGTQCFSLIVSGEDLTHVSNNIATPTGGYDPGNCNSNGEMLVFVTAMDSAGDGWGTNTYEIVNSSGYVVESVSLSGAVPNDFYTTRSYCLPVGDYSVELVDGGSSGATEMAVELGQCSLYLSEYKTSGEFSVTSAEDCNTCTIYELNMLLIGSIYGVPYGWLGNTHYTITQTKGGSASYAGTLTTGMLLEHKYCLVDGTYRIEFAQVADDDGGFLDDDFLAYYFGVEEYAIYLSDSDGMNVALAPPDYVVLTIENGESTSVSYNSDKSSDDDDNGLSDGAIAGIAISILVLLSGVVAGLVYCLCYKKSGTSSIQESAVETPSPMRK